MAFCRKGNARLDSSSSSPRCYPELTLSFSSCPQLLRLKACRG